MFPKNTAHTLLIYSNLFIILSILLFTFTRPPHHLSDFARGVRDRAYPPLRLQTNTLNVITAAANFIVFDLLERIWHALKDKRWGAIINSKKRLSCSTHTGTHSLLFWLQIILDHDETRVIATERLRRKDSMKTG